MAALGDGNLDLKVIHSHRVGSNCATLPRVLTENPDQTPGLALRFGPTLCAVRLKTICNESIASGCEYIMFEQDGNWINDDPWEAALDEGHTAIVRWHFLSLWGLSGERGAGKRRHGTLV